MSAIRCAAESQGDPMTHVELDAANRHSIGASEAGWTLPEIIGELAVDDPWLVAELIEAFHTDTTLRLLQMRETIADADIKGFRDAAHTIKGSALQMGAALVASLCQELELAALDTPAPELGRRVNTLERCVTEVCVEMDLCVNAKGCQATIGTADAKANRHSGGRGGTGLAD